MSAHHVKGHLILSTVRFVDQAFDASTGARIHAALPPDLREALLCIERGKWYPLDFTTQLSRSIYEAHDDPVAADLALRRCGYFIVDDASSTFLRLLLKILTPELFVSKYPEFWRRYHDFGDCRADASTIRQKRVLLRATSYDYAHIIGAGWVERAFHMFGMKNARVAHNGAPGQICVPEILWDVQWT